MNDCGRTALRTPLNGISVHVWRFIKADEMNRVGHFPEARSRLQTSVTSCPVLIGYRNDSARFPWTSFLGLLEAQVTRGDPKSGPHSIDFAVAVPTRRIGKQTHASISQRDSKSRAPRARILPILEQLRVSAAHLTIRPFTTHPWTHNFLLWAYCLKRTSMRFCTARGRLAAVKSLAIPAASAK